MCWQEIRQLEISLKSRIELCRILLGWALKQQLQPHTDRKLIFFEEAFIVLRELITVTRLQIS